MTNRELGLAALKQWYNASGLYDQNFSFDQVVSYYDGKSPSFIETFGSSTKYTTAEKLQSAMNDLGAASWQKLPNKSDFFNALVGQVLKLNLTDIKDIATKTVSDVKNVAVAGLGLYISILAIGALILLSSQMRARSAA
jgi:hypothetical protein